MDIDEADIHPNTLKLLKKAGFMRATDILHHSPAELAETCSINPQAASRALQAVAKLVIPPSMSALALASQPWSAVMESRRPTRSAAARLRFHDDILDGTLDGGIPLQGITEICGESSSGKTQSVLHLCTTAQLPASLGGLQAQVVYLSTEGSFPEQRLLEMIDARVQAQPELAEHLSGDHVLLKQASTTGEIDDALTHELPKLLQARPEIALLIVDSIAAVFRGEFHLSEMAVRSDTIFSFGRKLKALSDRFHLAIVCINQVSDYIAPEASLVAHSKLIPALGLSWSTCVNTRLVLRRVTSRHATTEQVKRSLTVAFAPHLPAGRSASFVVEKHGLKGLQNE
eukprot:TRINITY_DN9011_c0_g1_i5.p1 TRINITY_DN9011_c0_g1~~TRINITY_DN9011_c0_g1_i5.p1  ORF type:complete len:343 (+),score=71.02 TRINITY_DN9011_c0_g1_i5:134-1162(+)